MKKIILWLLLVVSIGYIMYSNLFISYPHNYMMFHHYGYYDDFVFGDYWLEMSLLFVAWVGVIFSGFFLLKGLIKKKSSPLQELDLRLARGDISKEEYILIKRELV